MRTIYIKDIPFSSKEKIRLIAGPCVIEDESSSFTIAKGIKDITERLGVPFIFKASYDKANRTSVTSFRGVGIQRGLDGEFIFNPKASLKS